MNIFGETNKTIARKYLDLEVTSTKSQVMYVWIDGSGVGLRAKTKTIERPVTSPEECPVWNYDGSSTGQSQGDDSDVYLYPVRIFDDPFRLGGTHKLLFCDCYDKHKKPVKGSWRSSCKEVTEKCAEKFDPWFGMEQEFTIIQPDGTVFGWPSNGYPGPQGKNYCSVGAGLALGRDILESAYRAFIYAGIEVAGSNAEDMPGQWEFQVGPCKGGLEMGDQMWMARFILNRVAEDYFVHISYDPKPVATGNWNGAGGHMNFSTKQTRADGGVNVIMDAIKKLEPKHAEHLAVYDPVGGADNRRRLTGTNETAHWSVFTHGVADRQASIRIPRQVAADGKGYMEDRRPAANCDPYRVCEQLLRTVCLDE